MFAGLLGALEVRAIAGLLASFATEARFTVYVPPLQPGTM